MKLPDIGGMYKVAKAAIQVHRPEILLGSALVATVSGVVLAAVGGYKSGKEVAQAEMQKDEPLTKAEIVELTWKNYLPAALAVTGAVASTTGLHLVHEADKKALIASGLAAVEQVKAETRQYVDDLKKSVEENTTDKAQKKINEAVMEKQAARDPEGVVEVQDDNGFVDQVYLVRDARTNQEIWSNKRQIDEAMLAVYNDMTKDGEASLSKFYEEAGFENTPDAHTVGWNADHPELKWSAAVNKAGIPVRVFRFQPEPAKEYYQATH